MTPKSLQKAVNSFIETVVLENFIINFQDSKGQKKQIKPEIIDGWLYPEKQTKENAKELEDKGYAKVATRVLSVKTEKNKTIVTLKLIVGLESNDKLGENSCAGYDEVLNLLERTKQELLKEGVIDKKYQIINDVQYSMPDEQFIPLWVGEMITNWELPNIVQENIEF